MAELTDKKYFVGESAAQTLADHIRTESISSDKAVHDDLLVLIDRLNDSYEALKKIVDPLKETVDRLDRINSSRTAGVVSIDNKDGVFVLGNGYKTFGSINLHTAIDGGRNVLLAQIETAGDEIARVSQLPKISPEDVDNLINKEWFENWVNNSLETEVSGLGFAYWNDVVDNYFDAAHITENFLTKQDASDTYYDYLKLVEFLETYLQNNILNAAMSAGYPHPENLVKSDDLLGLLSQTDASNIYLSKAEASETYQLKTDYMDDIKTFLQTDEFDSIMRGLGYLHVSDVVFKSDLPGILARDGYLKNINTSEGFEIEKSGSDVGLKLKLAPDFQDDEGEIKVLNLLMESEDGLFAGGTGTQIMLGRDLTPMAQTPERFIPDQPISNVIEQIHSQQISFNESLENFTTSLQSLENDLINQIQTLESRLNDIKEIPLETIKEWLQ